MRVTQRTLLGALGADQHVTILEATAEGQSDWNNTSTAIRTNLDGVRLSITYEDAFGKRYVNDNVLDFPRLDAPPKGGSTTYSDYVGHLAVLAKSYTSTV